MTIKTEDLTLTELLDGLNKTTVLRTEHRTRLIPKYFSEYQAAYRPWPWQPIRQSCRPSPPKKSTDKTNKIQRKTIYSIDYTLHEVPKQSKGKRPNDSYKNPAKSFDSKTTYKLAYDAKKLTTANQVEEPLEICRKQQKVLPQSERSKFGGSSIYTASFTPFDKKTIAACKPTPIKAKDNLDKKQQQAPEKPTPQPEQVNQPKPQTPDLNKVQPTEKPNPVPNHEEVCIDTRTDTAVAHSIVPEKLCKFNAISTAMADFVDPIGAKRRKPYYPDPSEHFVTGEHFDDRTTFRMTYKAWSPKPQEVPKWARKPVYKQPTEGMALITRYRSEFCDPCVVGKEATRVVPLKMRTNTINSAGGDMKYEYTSTYQQDFQCWEGSHAPESYNEIESYKPPTEPMMCETNQRAHFKGEQTEKAEPHRPVSQHRDLHDDKDMTFVTTYTEQFRDFRPKSSPCPACTSTCPTPTPPSLPKTRTTSIPKPDLSVMPTMNTVNIPKPPPGPKPSTPPPSPRVVTPVQIPIDQEPSASGSDLTMPIHKQSQPMAQKKYVSTRCRMSTKTPELVKNGYRAPSI